MKDEVFVQILIAVSGFLIVFVINQGTKALDSAKTSFREAMKEFSENIKEMKESIVELNINVAAVITRVDSHEKRITKLEDL